MDETDTFIELVKSICRRPLMYVCSGSFNEICAYLTGYAAASSDCPLSGDGWTAFNGFVCAAFRFPQKYVWPYVLREASRDDDEAVERLQCLLIEFAERMKTQSPAEIVREAMSRAKAHEEGEPEKTWRKFSRALHRGNREDIEPLIQEHPHAEVLWSGAYPDDVVPLMDQIAESYLVSQISGSEDAGEVTIITPDFGPMPVRLIDGTWRINVTKIIDCRRRNMKSE